ncbi:MAG: MetQ/NlpA family ABC transporter substrate-binding protein [Oscillibacter sp.]
MNKKKLLSLALGLSLTLSLAACGEKPAEAVTLKVAASSTPHAEILAVVKDTLAEQGIDLQVTAYTDYVIPNTAVEEGAEDANYFQHTPYMEDFNAKNGTHLVNAGGVHVEPMGIYAGKCASLDALPDGATIAIPNDATNEGRALLLLEAQGLIKLKADAGLVAMPKDIAENPKNLEFLELEAAMLPNGVDEVDLSVINCNYALEAGFNPVKDALAIEAADSPYVNIISVKEGHEKDPAVVALVEALHSDAVRTFIEETYKGAVVPAF